MTNKNSYYASLYVGDLHPDVDETVLHDLFRPFGEIISIRVCRDIKSGRSLRYGFVNFRNEKDAQHAIEELNLHKILDVPCRIMWSENGHGLSSSRSNNANIFISNLESSITAIQIYDTFSHFGEIISCKLQTDKNQRSRGSAFVQYKYEEDALRAIEVVNGKMIKRQIVVVGKFIPRTKTNKDSDEFTNCFIKNFGTDLTDESLKELFEPFGEIVSAKVMMSDEGVSKGFGFVSFKNPKDAEDAIEKLNGKLINNKNIYVGRAVKAVSTMKQVKEKPRQMNVNTNLYVKNFDKKMTDEGLKQMFSEFGSVTSAKIMIDEKENESKQFGFISFSTHKEALRALLEINGKIVDGKPLFVNFAQRKEDRIQLLCRHFEGRMNQKKVERQHLNHL